MKQFEAKTTLLLALSALGFSGCQKNTPLATAIPKPIVATPRPTATLSLAQIRNPRWPLTWNANPTQMNSSAQTRNSSGVQGTVVASNTAPHNLGEKGYLETGDPMSHVPVLIFRFDSKGKRQIARIFTNHKGNFRRRLIPGSYGVQIDPRASSYVNHEIRVYIWPGSFASAMLNYDCGF